MICYFLCRKYVDPSSAVDILRGFIGTQNSSSNAKDILNIETNNQQDVSEFTHIVLEWVEDAFKGDTENQRKSDAMQTDEAECEKENNEEKDAKETEAKGENPMAKLFYGKVVREGRFNGDAFLRQENFGQWPLQVNTCSNLHESLEKSLAHEQFDSSAEDSLAEQEGWFDKLPPVLFLELSRFQYNMERKTAEKIHNRLEFPERLFMDRYVSANKEVTRMKREEVRALKERRGILKSKLDKFTHYGKGQDVTVGMPLPDILQRTMDFANSSQSRKEMPANPNVASAYVASSLMQVDSPVSSPKMTPATSLSNLASHAEVSNQIDGDEAMDVEMTDNSGSKEEEMNGCDTTKQQEQDLKGASLEPFPKFVSEAELRLLQVILPTLFNNFSLRSVKIVLFITGLFNEMEI